MYVAHQDAFFWFQVNQVLLQEIEVVVLLALAPRL